MISIKNASRPPCLCYFTNYFIFRDTTWFRVHVILPNFSKLQRELFFNKFFLLSAKFSWVSYFGKFEHKSILFHVTNYFNVKRVGQCLWFWLIRLRESTSSSVYWRKFLSRRIRAKYFDEFRKWLRKPHYSIIKPFNFQFECSKDFIRILENC